MKPECDITVLMPVYNGEDYLKEAIESILNQTFKDFEFLIINDGSTDKTLEILQSYYDSRIKTINNEKNIGLTKSLNKGLHLSRGQYIARMDADDISLPKRLKEQKNFMDKNPEIGIVGAWIKTIGTQIGYVQKYPSDPEEIRMSLLFRGQLAHPSVMLRKSLVKKYNLYYDSNFKYSQDDELWIRASRYFPITNIEKVLLLYRIHEKRVSEVYHNIQKKNAEIVKINQLKNLGISSSKEELIIHQSINKPAYYKKEDFIDKVEVWLKKLKKQNKKTKFYQEKAFSKFISLRWLVICYVNTDIGFWAWKKFWNSSLSQGIKIDRKSVV